MRRDMKVLWNSFSSYASPEGMMLNSEASKLSSLDIEEIMANLPDIKGKRCLELGAGIGRHTGLLAEICDHVTAVDFIEAFVEKNREVNGDRPNVDIVHSDVMRLDIPPESYDVIFTNWLLMYQADEELKLLSQRFLGWLRDGGYLFFRETCFHTSGDLLQKHNTFDRSRYRHPKEYNIMFQSVRGSNMNPTVGFQLLYCRNVQTFATMKYNPTQYFWLWQKRRLAADEELGRMEYPELFLDGKLKSIMEKLLDNDNPIDDGCDNIRDIAEMLNLQPKQSVLDVGCGSGDDDFFLARNYDVNVLGIDLSSSLIGEAIDVVREQTTPRVLFEIGDITEREFKAASYDVIYSRDVLLYIRDKPTMFRKFMTWLKPGGRLAILDHCSGARPQATDSGLTRLTMETYEERLTSAGFAMVKTVDRTPHLMRLLRKGLARITEESKHTPQDENIQALLEFFSAKITRVSRGSQKWGLFLAEKAK
ncbi:uncharacterized protein [Diadema antillarum]|uniref:uncharacterized protein n=1 Tax=Diadema antillarum TaxID=105358 RepID=UPI003A853340